MFHCHLMMILVYNGFMSEYYIGLSLGAASSIESGIAVLQDNGQLCYVDKLFSINDVVFFFDQTYIILRQNTLFLQDTPPPEKNRLL